MIFDEATANLDHNNATRIEHLLLSDPNITYITVTHHLIKKNELYFDEILLSHGDIVYVPTNANSKVYVMGEAGRQAALRIGNHGLNLTEAIGEAGGMNQALADATGVFVIRNAPQDIEKPIHIYQLDLKDATAYALGNEFKLRANDLVYITAAPVTRWNRVVSQLINSFTGDNSLGNTFN